MSLLEHSTRGDNEQSVREMITELNANSKRFDNAYIKTAVITNKILNLTRPVVDIFHK